MPGMPDTAASRKRQNQGLCVLSPESDRRTTAKAWRMGAIGSCVFLPIAGPPDNGRATRKSEEGARRTEEI